MSAEITSKSTYAVTHIAETIRGGIATYLREIVALQVKRYGSDRVVVIAPEEQIGDLGEQPGALLLGVRSARSRFQTAWRVRRRLLSLIASRSTDILHVHSAFAGMTCRVGLPGSRIGRTIYCPHGWAFVRTGRSARLAASIEYALARRSDAIICVSASEQNAALERGLPRGKLNVIHNGLPDRTPSKTDKYNGSALHILFIGRLDRAKGFDVLVAALRSMQRETVVDVFGQSVLGEYTADELPACVRMHGWQTFDVIERFLSKCDVVVMPSRWEALGLSAIEAMRAAKPTIGTNVGGLSELIEDGVTGRLVPPDDPDTLAQVINTADSTELAEMGQRARIHFLEQFRIEQCESDLADLYNSSAGRTPS